MKVDKVTQTGKPNSIAIKFLKRGGQDVTFYDKKGRMTKQFSNHNHGNPKTHPYGEHGEHVHDIIWDKGKIVGRPPRELTQEERKELRTLL